jgi:signal peptidase I
MGNLNDVVFFFTELRWAISVAAFAGSFWLTLAFVLSNDLVSLTSVPSESMAPGVHRGDLMLVDRRAKVDSRAVGEVVLFEPPPALKQIAVDNGTVSLFLISYGQFE